MKLSNNKTVRRNPINRNNLFFSNEDYDFEIELAKNYMEEDMNQTIILYEVDLEKTKINTTYNESSSDDIYFKTPIELTVIFDIDDADLMTYDKQQMKGYYLKSGKLHFSVLEKTLEENECDIKRGDYIGIQVTPEHMEYFIVANDGKKNYGNSQSLYGFKPFYRDIECAPITDNNEIINTL